MRHKTRPNKECQQEQIGEDGFGLSDSCFHLRCPVRLDCSEIIARMTEQSRADNLRSEFQLGVRDYKM